MLFMFRCPICRELIRIPAGGVQAIPPSFLVNQLIDLMARQIREVIPNCSTHENQVYIINVLGSKPSIKTYHYFRSKNPKNCKFLPQPWSLVWCVSAMILLAQTATQ